MYVDMAQKGAQNKSIFKKPPQLSFISRSI